MNVLLIDDRRIKGDNYSMDPVVNYLSSKGITSFTYATTGNEAINELSNNDYIMIISDLIIPFQGDYINRITDLLYRDYIALKIFTDLREGKFGELNRNKPFIFYSSIDNFTIYNALKNNSSEYKTGIAIRPEISNLIKIIDSYL